MSIERNLIPYTCTHTHRYIYQMVYVEFAEEQHGWHWKFIEANGTHVHINTIPSKWCK